MQSSSNGDGTFLRAILVATACSRRRSPNAWTSRNTLKKKGGILSYYENHLIINLYKVETLGYGHRSEIVVALGTGLEVVREEWEEVLRGQEGAHAEQEHLPRAHRELAERER